SCEEKLQRWWEAADDRVERHKKVLNPAFDQLVLGDVHDHRGVEDRLAARVQGGIQVGHPSRVRGHLHGHRVSFQGARDMHRQGALQFTAATQRDKFMRPWKLPEGAVGGGEAGYDVLTRYMVEVDLAV